MGCMKELWEIEQRHKTELAFVRAEAAYEAVPQTLREGHDMIRQLQHVVLTLSRRAEESGSYWEERMWGFGFGVLASLIASALWQGLSGHLNVLVR